MMLAVPFDITFTPILIWDRVILPKFLFMLKPSRFIYQKKKTKAYEQLLVDPNQELNFKQAKDFITWNIENF